MLILWHDPHKESHHHGKHEKESSRTYSIWLPLTISTHILDFIYTEASFTSLTGFSERSSNNLNISLEATTISTGLHSPNRGHQDAMHNSIAKRNRLRSYTGGHCKDKKCIHHYIVGYVVTSFRRIALMMELIVCTNAGHTLGWYWRLIRCIVCTSYMFEYHNNAMRPPVRRMFWMINMTNTSIVVSDRIRKT